MTQVITERALREFVSESFDTPAALEDEIESSKEDELPCIVNPSMDSSLATIELSPVDVQFVPHNQVEFGIAIKQMAKNLPDEVIPMLYAKVREIMMDAQEEVGPEDQGDTTEMEKRDRSRLGMEGVRKVIRKMISEMGDGGVFAEDEKDGDGPSKKDDLAGRKRKMNLAGGIENDFPDEDFEVRPGAVWDEEAWDDVSDPEGAAAHAAEVDRDEDEEEFGDDPFNTSSVDAETSSDWDPEPAVPAGPKKPNRKESETGYGVEGDQLRRIAAELGISPSGVKRLLTVGLGKMGYMAELGPENVKDIVHGAARDWVEMLVDKGRIEDKEGRLWLKHLDIVAQNDEFRDFLHSYIRDEMKKDDEWVYDKKESEPTE